MPAHVVPVLTAASSLALAVLPVAATQLASPVGPELGPGRLATSFGALTDLDPYTPDPTDGARALALAALGPRSTQAFLAVVGFDRGATGRTFGAHVHTGPCVAGEPNAAGPHVKVADPPSPRTEIWLDLTVNRWGFASAVAAVPFPVPAGGARSIVIHAEPTRPDGAAGDRLACLPLEL